MTSRTERNFDDFDNMLKGIHCEDDLVSYTAILIVDRVKLERDAYRSIDVDAWYERVFFGRRDVFQSAVFRDNYGIGYGDDSDVSDIED